MSSGWIIAIEFSLAALLMVGFGVWQLVSLRKYRDQDRADRERKDGR